MSSGVQGFHGAGAPPADQCGTGRAWEPSAGPPNPPGQTKECCPRTPAHHFLTFLHTQGQVREVKQEQRRNGRPGTPGAQTWRKGQQSRRQMFALLPASSPAPALGLVID